MSKINLNRGDSAIIIRHLDKGFDVEIYHSHDKNLLTEEDTMFYALLTRGMVHTAIRDTDQVLEDGRQSIDEEIGRVTIHWDTWSTWRWGLNKHKSNLIIKN